MKQLGGKKRSDPICKHFSQIPRKKRNKNFRNKFHYKCVNMRVYRFRLIGKQIARPLRTNGLQQ